jgi:16S rRNA (cytosine967-C5)-methyltransferase
VEALARALDRPAELDDLLVSDNERPRVTLVARPGLSTVEELAASGEGAEPSISPLGVTLDGGDPGALPAVRDGRAGVQDAGSQLVALALSRATVDGRDERWLDLCAGPGGKAALLAALATGRGARLLANERLPHRARLVAQAIRATVGDVVTGDGTRPPWQDATFDRALVDAPCSGLGALRRRPESRWRRTRSDVEGLVPLQVALLTSALDSVRPGGVVLYATCSPVVEETIGVVATVLAERSDVRLEDARPLVPEAADAESAHLAGAVQLWPHRHGTDAMFMALLRRLPDGHP